MTKYKEAEDRSASELELITGTIAQLATAIQTQNDVLLCLLHKFDVEKDMPVWVTKEGLEKEITPKVKACIETVRKFYGPSKADKS